MALGFQFGTNFGMIVDFAVEDDDATTGVQGLHASGEVDNSQAHRTKRDRIRLKNALLIGTAVHDGLRRAADQIRVGTVTPVGKSSDSTHSFTSVARALPLL